MTKRLKSKHKVDRRLKANLWGRPKSLSTQEHILPGSTGRARKENQQIMEFNYKLNKSLRLIMEI
tara:strand:+ start:116 stop:310 length:195 start_codon:yes stop_codon:yes gene_type:complete